MSKAGKRGAKVSKAKQSGKKHAKKHHQSQEAAAHSKDLLDREMSSVYSMVRLKAAHSHRVGVFLMSFTPRWLLQRRNTLLSIDQS